jgi:hypothetical protein
MGLTRDRPCSILGPCYALPVRFGISVVFVGPAVAPVAVQGRYPQHADAICPASWTAPYSYLTGDVQGFVGSLVGLGATKGVFVTTSSFSHMALEFVRHLSQRVILIDGEKLTELMIEHNVGVRLNRAIEFKRLDEDFFAEDD